MGLTYLIGRRNAQNTPWTSERDALLARLWSEGYSASQIAEQIMGVTVTRMAVIGRVHRLKLPARKPREPARTPRPRRTRGFVPKPPAPPPRPQPPPPPPGAPKMRRLKLVELKPTSCRWPIGEGDEIRFCGVTVMEGQVYCPHHFEKAHVRKRD